MPVTKRPITIDSRLKAKVVTIQPKLNNNVAAMMPPLRPMTSEKLLFSQEPIT